MRDTDNNSRKVRVALTSKEVADICDHTFANPGYFAMGIVAKTGKTEYNWSLEDFEDLLGHIAASANHCESKALEKRLDAIYFKLDGIFEAFNNPKPRQRRPNKSRQKDAGSSPVRDQRQGPGASAL